MRRSLTSIEDDRWRHRVLARLAAAALVACGSAAGAQSAPPAGAIAGVVRDSVGQGVAGAEVTLGVGAARVVSSAGGGYRLTQVPAGPVVLHVRRLGFRPLVLQAVVREGETVAVDLWLVPLPQQLRPVVVTERREPFDSRLEGFHERRAKRVGHFVTRDQIDRRRTSIFTDLLRDIPGVRISPRPGIARAVRIRGAACAPLVFIDGAPASAGEFDLDGVDPVSVEGIEVYSSSSTVPAQLLGPRDLARCGVIAIWSRPADVPARREPPRGEPVRLEDLLESEELFTAEQVDEPAALAEELVTAYPDSLWDAAVRGRVVVEFVVGVDGGVEPGTVRTVSSSHPAFAESVRQALTGARFAPARTRGRPVRQVVQLPFEFVRR